MTSTAFSKTTLGLQEFTTIIKKQLTDDGDQYEGDLSTLGGCIVKVTESPKKTTVSMEQDGKILVKFIVFDDDTVTYDNKSTADGSSLKTYANSYSRLRRVINDDANDYWEIETPSTKLQCDRDY